MGSFERSRQVPRRASIDALAFAAWLSYDWTLDPTDLTAFEDAYRGEWDSLHAYAESWAEEIGLFDQAEAVGLHTSASTSIRSRAISTSRCTPSPPPGHLCLRTELTMTATDLTRFLKALFERTPDDSFVELRYRVPTGMRQSFHATTTLHLAEDEILTRSQTTDVYLGVLPRVCRSGRREHVLPVGHTVWVDCDSTEAVAALDAFSPQPSMMVRSGTNNNCHGYWFVKQSLSLDAVEDTNHRLAEALGIRPQQHRRCTHPPASAFDQPQARGLQLGDSHLRPSAQALRPRRDHSTCARALSSSPSSLFVTAMRRPDDPLLAIIPQTYVERLTGEQIILTWKIPCPFHADDTPSLHVYRQAERGWTCYGCGRGGTIYDFAALLWDMTPRGAGFHQLRGLLAEIFLGQQPA